jgi:hypothetical protein
MTLTLTATEMGSTYDAAITVSIEYTDPCLTEWPVITLDTFSDMAFGLFELEQASQTATFTTVTDVYSCTASCGELVATLTFASDAVTSGLSAAVSMTGLVLTIDTSTVGTTMISENTVTLTITYANCATSTATQDFDLDIECTTGSDIGLTDGSSTDLTFNFITDTSLTTTFTYTHSYCDPHTVTF